MTPSFPSTRRVATYHNPVIPGCHPDPSVCRVGDDYYLVNSSFEYFPGIPIFTCRDLVHWRQIGHVLTRDSQAPLRGVQSSRGVFAPTIRYHSGTFYVVSSIVDGGGLFYVTAADPAGPWSEPIWLDEGERGMDPSLFFDDDGKVYYTLHIGGENGAIFQAELELATGRSLAAPREIWRGTGGIWPEGPHLYKIGGRYYLLIAEGGTSYGHTVTVARSQSPWGPFEAYAGNPILSHRNLQGHPIQATGHGDLVQTQSGAFWLVFLGIRPTDGAHHHLGRETFLAPVTFDNAGWPVVNGGEPIGLTQSAEGLPPLQTAVAAVARDDFAVDTLPVHYGFVRNPCAKDGSLTERPGVLRLRGTGVTLNDVGSPAFVGRRQEHFDVRVSTLVDFAPESQGPEAGMVVRMNEKNHYELALTFRGGHRRVLLRTTIAGIATTLADAEVGRGPVALSIEGASDHYEFFCGSGDNERISLGAAPTAPLSSESAGGFTGVYVGMYAQTSSSEPAPPADFDGFEYQPL